MRAVGATDNLPASPQLFQVAATLAIAYADAVIKIHAASGGSQDSNASIEAAQGFDRTADITLTGIQCIAGNANMNKWPRMNWIQNSIAFFTRL